MKIRTVLTVVVAAIIVMGFAAPLPACPY